MIYTLTFNPSIDYITFFDEMKVGEINRTQKEIFNPGGKGINVSLVLRNLGFESTALGFLAGFVGNDIAKLLEKENIKTKFVHVSDGMSRINVKIRAKEESEINGMGPKILTSDLEKLYNILDELKDGDVLVISGSIPKSLPETIYGDILDRIRNKNIKTIVDSHGKVLFDSLKYNPFLVKPNNKELEDLFKIKIENNEQIIQYAKRLQEEGARNVLVSMAGDGAVLVTEDGDIYQEEAPKGDVSNSVGAGDSMVAGFLAGYLLSGNYEEAFYVGLCTGSASAFSDNMATKKEVIDLLKTYNKNYKF